MTKNDFFEIVASILNVPTDSLKLDSTPGQIPSWDSLAHVSMCAAMEQSLNIQFSMAEMLSIKSLSDMVDMLTKHGIILD